MAICRTVAGGLRTPPEEAKAMGFWALNLDTFLMSLLLGAVFMFVFHRAAKSITTGAPSGIQNFCEWAHRVHRHQRARFIFRQKRHGRPVGADHLLLGFCDEPDGFVADRLCALVDARARRSRSSRLFLPLIRMPRSAWRLACFCWCCTTA